MTDQLVFPGMPEPVEPVRVPGPRPIPSWLLPVCRFCKRRISEHGAKGCAS